MKCQSSTCIMTPDVLCRSMQVTEMHNLREKRNRRANFKEGKAETILGSVSGDVVQRQPDVQDNLNQQADVLQMEY